MAVRLVMPVHSGCKFAPFARVAALTVMETDKASGLSDGGPFLRGGES